MNEFTKEEYTKEEYPDIENERPRASQPAQIARGFVAHVKTGRPEGRTISFAPREVPRVYITDPTTHTKILLEPKTLQDLVTQYAHTEGIDPTTLEQLREGLDIEKYIERMIGSGTVIDDESRLIIAEYIDSLPEEGGVQETMRDFLEEKLQLHALTINLNTAAQEKVPATPEDGASANESPTLDEADYPTMPVVAPQYPGTMTLDEAQRDHNTTEAKKNRRTPYGIPGGAQALQKTYENTRDTTETPTQEDVPSKEPDVSIPPTPEPSKEKGMRQSELLTLLGTVPSDDLYIEHLTTAVEQIPAESFTIDGYGTVSKDTLLSHLRELATSVVDERGNLDPTRFAARFGQLPLPVTIKRKLRTHLFSITINNSDNATTTKPPESDTIIPTTISNQTPHMSPESGSPKTGRTPDASPVGFVDPGNYTIHPSSSAETTPVPLPLAGDTGLLANLLRNLSGGSPAEAGEYVAKSADAWGGSATKDPSTDTRATPSPETPPASATPPAPAEKASEGEKLDWMREILERNDENPDTNPEELIPAGPAETTPPTPAENTPTEETTPTEEAEKTPAPEPAPTEEPAPETKPASPWEVARTDVRALMSEVKTARTEYLEKMEAYERSRREKGLLGRTFSFAHTPEEDAMNKAEEAYNAILNNVPDKIAAYKKLTLATTRETLESADSDKKVSIESKKLEKAKQASLIATQVAMIERMAGRDVTQIEQERLNRDERNESRNVVTKLWERYRTLNPAAKIAAGAAIAGALGVLGAATAGAGIGAAALLGGGVATRRLVGGTTGVLAGLGTKLLGDRAADAYVEKKYDAYFDPTKAGGWNIAKAREDILRLNARGRGLKHVATGGAAAVALLAGSGASATEAAFANDTTVSAELSNIAHSYAHMGRAIIDAPHNIGQTLLSLFDDLHGKASGLVAELNQPATSIPTAPSINAVPPQVAATPDSLPQSNAVPITLAGIVPGPASTPSIDVSRGLTDAVMRGMSGAGVNPVQTAQPIIPSPKTGTQGTFGIGGTIDQAPPQTPPSTEKVSTNPAFHTIHRVDWYDNDTTRFDKNELRLHWGGDQGSGIDANGNYVFDVSHMTRGGSSAGSLSMDAQDALKKGELKMLLSVSRDSQTTVVEVPIGADGKAVIDPKSEIGKMLFKNENGHATFVGQFAEVGQSVGKGPDGVEQYRIAATHVGSGKAVMPEKVVIAPAPSTTPPATPQDSPKPQGTPLPPEHKAPLATALPVMEPTPPVVGSPEYNTLAKEIGTVTPESYPAADSTPPDGSHRQGTTVKITTTTLDNVAVNPSARKYAATMKATAGEWRDVESIPAMGPEGGLSKVGQVPTENYTLAETPPIGSTPRFSDFPYTNVSADLHHAESAVHDHMALHYSAADVLPAKSHEFFGNLLRDGRILADYPPEQKNVLRDCMDALLYVRLNGLGDNTPGLTYTIGSDTISLSADTERVVQALITDLEKSISQAHPEVVDLIAEAQRDQLTLGRLINDIRLRGW